MIKELPSGNKTDHFLDWTAGSSSEANELGTLGSFSPCTEPYSMPGTMHSAIQGYTEGEVRPVLQGCPPGSREQNTW